MIAVAVGVTLAFVSVLVRVMYLAEFVCRSRSMLPWMYGALALDAAVLAAGVIVGRPLEWLPVVLWLALTGFDVSYLFIGRYMLRGDEAARRKLDEAELIASLPAKDRAWVQKHLELATIRLADRAAVRRA